MIMKCPGCSTEVEYIEGESRFCSECGKELSPQSAAADKENEDFIKIDSSDGSGSNDPSDMPRPSEWNLSERSRKILDDDDFFQPGRMRFSECPHLRVEYNQNLFFLAGSKSLIKLKLTPIDNDLQDLLIFMETERGENHTRRQIPVKEVLQRNREIFLQVPFSIDEIFGKICLVFYIGCKINGSFSYYQFSVDHKIYNSNQSSTALCNQITINQEFTSNHAADINYRDSIGEALKKMADKTMTVNEMIDRLNDLPPKYGIQILTKTTWRPEDVLIKGDLFPTNKLKLEFNGKRILLINKPQVTFGRNPELVDLCVRCSEGNIGRRDFLNLTVSRKHAEILYCEDTVKLFDYSSHGTYINGKKPDSAGIPLGLNALIEFGDIHWRMKIQECKNRLPHNICKTCSACKVKSVTFTRTDKEPEYYLLVWQCCELGRIIEELTDWTVFTRNDYFFIRTPEQDFYHLRPGKKIVSGNVQIDVKFFEEN